MASGCLGQNRFRATLNFWLLVSPFPYAARNHLHLRLGVNPNREIVSCRVVRARGLDAYWESDKILGSPLPLSPLTLGSFPFSIVGLRQTKGEPSVTKRDQVRPSENQVRSSETKCKRSETK